MVIYSKWGRGTYITHALEMASQRVKNDNIKSFIIKNRISLIFFAFRHDP